MKVLHGVPSSFLCVSLAHQMEELELPSGSPGVGGMEEMGGGQEGGKGCFFRIEG